MKKSRIQSITEDTSPIVIEKQPIKWLYFVPLALLLAASVSVTIWYLLDQKKNSAKKSRLNSLDTNLDLLDKGNKKLFPENLPTDSALKRGVELYQSGFISASEAKFQEIIDSTKSNKVKSMALTYLGIIADDQGKFNLAVNFFDRAISLNSENFFAYYNKAISQRHKGEFSKALKTLEKASSLRPELVDTNLLRGQIQLDAGDNKSATESFFEGAEKNDPRSWYNLGVQYRKMGSIAEAKAAFLKAMDLQPRGEVGVKASVQLGIIFANQGDFKNSEYYFLHSVQFDPTNAKNHYNLALIQSKLNKKKVAIESLKRSVSLGKSESDIWLFIARLYRDLGETEAALSTLNLSKSKSPLNPDILTELGDLEIDLGQWSSAKATMEQLLSSSARQKDKAKAWYNLGRIHRALKEYDVAISAFKKVNDLDTGNEDASVQIAETYFEKGRPDLAISELRKALRMNPDRRELLRIGAKIYLEKKIFNESEQFLRRLLAHPTKTESDTDFANFNIGKIYLHKNNFKVARSYFEKVKSATDENMRFEAMLKLSEAILSAHEPVQSAIDILLQAEALKPRSSIVRFHLAKARLQKGSLTAREEAEEDLTGIIATETDAIILSRSHTLRGIIYYKDGFYLKAMDEFTRALELDPSNREAFENRRTTSARLEGLN